MTESDPEKRYTVRITISSLGNERRNVSLTDLSKEKIEQLLDTLSAGFNTVRTNSSLLLTDADGQVVLANLDNVVFIEVQFSE